MTAPHVFYVHSAVMGAFRTMCSGWSGVNTLRRGDDGLAVHARRRKPVVIEGVPINTKAVAGDSAGTTVTWSTEGRSPVGEILSDVAWVATTPYSAGDALRRISLPTVTYRPADPDDLPPLARG